MNCKAYATYRPSTIVLVPVSADRILTANPHDFPADIVGLCGMEVFHPDRFIVNQWDLDPPETMAAFERMRAQRKQTWRRLKISRMLWNATGFPRPHSVFGT